MSISAPTALAVTPQSGFIVPPMAAEPLATAHQNINYLWGYHSPPMVDVCPTLTAAQTRHTIAVPVLPSVDGIKYAGVVCVVPSATSTFDWTIKYCTSYTGTGTTWTSWASATGIAGTAGVLSAIAVAATTLPANAVAMQLDVQAASGTVAVHHWLLYPRPDASGTGTKTSGFTPSDDGLLTTAGAAIHTEWLNRCKSSPLALLADRAQAAYSFAQAEGNTVAYFCTAPNWVALPVGRLWLPYQTAAVLAVKIIASALGGTTTDCVRLRQSGRPLSEAVTADADRTIQSGTMTVYPQGEAGQAYVDLICEAKQATGGNNVRIHAVMAWWVPLT